MQRRCARSESKCTRRRPTRERPAVGPPNGQAGRTNSERQREKRWGAPEGGRAGAGYEVLAEFNGVENQASKSKALDEA